MTAAEFRSLLAATFPEVVAAFTEYDHGLLHCEVGSFRRCTEEAMDGGKEWLAERHFRMVAEVLPAADAELRNALDVSYLEDLALGELTAQRHGIIRDRMPKLLREEIIRINSRWR